MALLPDKHNFTIWRGATFRSQLTLYTDAGVTLRNLTGYTATMPILDPQTSSSLLTLSSGSGITLGGAAGTIDIVISASTTAALTWTAAKYDLLITAPSAGDTDALLFGGITVRGI